MHVSATLLRHTPSSITPNPKTTPFKTPSPFSRSFDKSSPTRRASPSSQCYSEFNLYELLGVDASSDRAQIKEAYRALQKRCHPDIYGPEGHHMSIVLNEAYALLSDPNSRMAYDKELAEVADLQGYTGRPMYSSWLGPETEQRAVFVDEVKCIGCLKCALFADKTFAVESVYGRARVVAQWADPEYKIQEAINVCPVDCISIVERSNLAALEFLMSKQPRGRVRIGAGNTAGVRISDIFDELDKFQTRYARHKSSTTNYAKDLEAHRASRVSAIQAIQMISNWLYWQTPATYATPLATQNSQPGSRKHAGPSVKRLKAAAEARKQATTTTQQNVLSPNNTQEYWVPMTPVLQESSATESPAPKASTGSTPSKKKSNRAKSVRPYKEGAYNPFRSRVPIGIAIGAAGVIQLQLGESAGGGLNSHIGGSLALDVVNSDWMQVGLAGVTWYLVGICVVGLAEAIGRK